MTTTAGTSQLTLESGATIDVGGLWVNAQINPGNVNQLAFLNGAGPRVKESGLGLIPSYAYSAPYEDLTLAQP